jgi:hypothetical protein
LLHPIVELVQSIPNFPRILNRDLRPVLQHARVSSPNAGALNLFISGIPYALDSYRQFVTPVYAVFFPTQQRILIPPGGTEEIIASILSQNRTVPGYLRNRLDSGREIATVAMDEPDDGMNMAIFNAEAVSGSSCGLGIGIDWAMVVNEVKRRVAGVAIPDCKTMDDQIARYQSRRYKGQRGTSGLPDEMGCGCPDKWPICDGVGISIRSRLRATAGVVGE